MTFICFSSINKYEPVLQHRHRKCNPLTHLRQPAEKTIKKLNDILTIKVFLTFIFLTFYFHFNLSSQEPTRWRGPEANGIYPETGLLKKWPQNGPEIIWTFEQLGEGHSSPAISGGYIYIPTMINGMGYIFKLSMEGKLIWKAEYGHEFTESYPGARATTTVAGDILYMLSGTGILVCMNTSDGKIRWKKDLFRDFDGHNIRWGLNETVVVDGDKLYCTPGGKKHNIIALNRFTGELIWASPGKGEKAAYCTPLIIRLPAREILVTFSETNILGIDSSNGKLLWHYPWPSRWLVHANTPLYHEGSVFCFSGYGEGAIMFKLSSDGSSIQTKWKDKSFSPYIGGAVLVDGYIYGSSDEDRIWYCLDWETGRQMYSSKALGKGVVIYADGMLYCYSDRGELALVKADPSGFHIVSKTLVTKGSGQHWAHPVIYEGILYLHRGSALMAYKIR